MILVIRISDYKLGHSYHQFDEDVNINNIKQQASEEKDLAQWYQPHSTYFSEPHWLYTYITKTFTLVHVAMYRSSGAYAEVAWLCMMLHSQLQEEYALQVRQLPHTVSDAAEPALSCWRSAQHMNKRTLLDDERLRSSTESESTMTPSLALPQEAYCKEDRMLCTYCTLLYSILQYKQNFQRTRLLTSQ